MSKKQESFQFEKFMEDIVDREDQAKERSAEYAKKHADTPQRIYNKLYRERWQNRIKWGRK
jgi:hypothetical protein